MFKYILASVAFLTFARPVWADDTRFSLTTDFKTAYISKGRQIGGDTLFIDGGASFGSWGLGAILVTPLGDHSKFFEHELDLYVQKNFSLSEKTALNLGLLYYTATDKHIESEEGMYWKSDTFEPYVNISFEAPLNPSASVNYDIAAERLFFRGNIGYGFPLRDSLSLNLHAQLGYAHRNKKTEPSYAFGIVGAKLQYAFKNASVYAGVKVGVADHKTYYKKIDKNRGVVGKKHSGVWFGVGISTSF